MTSRQYFIIEVPQPSPAEHWEATRVKLAQLLGVSLRQVIVVYGAHVNVLEITDPGKPGKDRSK